MPSLDDLIAEVKAEQGLSIADRVDQTIPTARYATPAMPLSEAVTRDAEALSAMDPTQPSNLPGILHQGIPIALQALVAGRGGPGAAQGMGRVTQAARSALGSLLGYGFQEGVEPLARGEAPTATPEGALLSLGLGAGSDLAMQGGGAMLRRVTGKTGMLAGGEEAARLAEFKAVQAQEKAQQKVLTRAEALEQVKLKHSDEALANVRQDVLEQDVKNFLGAPSPLDNPTIETLSERVVPVRESAERNVRGIFKGLSSKFETMLAPYAKLPVQGNFSAAVDAERAILDTNKETVSRGFANLLDDVQALDTGTFNTASLPPNLRAEYQRLQGTMPKEALDKYISKVAGGMQGGAPTTAPTDVAAVDNIRSKLVATVIGRSSPTEKRVANRLIQSIDESLEPVLPENIRANWGTLRREWREANSVFSPRFRSTLFRADTPAAVADVLYGASKGGKAHRAATVIAQTPADELPLLRSAFADRLTRGDVVKNVQGLDKGVFKSLYGGSGFDDPKEWVEALGTNLSQRLDLPAVMADPALAAKFQSRYQQGLSSLGVKVKERALARAEDLLRKTPDPASVIRGAMEAGEMEGMKTPIMGKRIHNYIENRHAWQVSMGLLALGAYGGPFSHPAEALPFLYLGGGKAANAALSNPTFGKMWHSALKSKNFEQAGFWLGRLAAASLTEGVRSESK